MSCLVKAKRNFRKLHSSRNLHGLSIYDMSSIALILDDLQADGHSGTISKRLSEWFFVRGFEVYRSGIGWKITLKGGG